jgi:predicted nucleic acid-binding protein
MRFWDASAIVPLLIEERSSQVLRALLTDDPLMVVWWATPTECASALARLDREGLLDTQSLRVAHKRLSQLAANWEEVDPHDEVRETAARFLRVHPLRAGDALQLAAAFVAAGRRPASLGLVTLDERLATAAQKEGFVTVEVGAGE